MEDDKQQTIRLQRRAIERRKDEVIREARVMAFGDARKARPDLIQALHDLSEAERRLAELSDGGQLSLPALPSDASESNPPTEGDAS